MINAFSFSIKLKEKTQEYNLVNDNRKYSVVTTASSYNRSCGHIHMIREDVDILFYCDEILSVIKYETIGTDLSDKEITRRFIDCIDKVSNMVFSGTLSGNLSKSVLIITDESKTHEVTFNLYKDVIETSEEDDIIAAAMKKIDIIDEQYFFEKIPEEIVQTIVCRYENGKFQS